MKKILSLMVCLTLAICSGVVLAACGGKKEQTPPAPTFTVGDDVAEKATKIVDELQTDVYNNATLGKDHAPYTYEAAKEALKDTDHALAEGYWVDCGTLANMNLAQVNSITLGGVTYDKTDTFKLSIGNNNFIEEEVFTIGQDGKVKIAAPVVAFELQRATSKLTVGTTQFDFLTNENAAELQLGKAEVKNADGVDGDDEVVTNSLEKVAKNVYNYNVNSGDDYVLLTPDTTAQPTAETALDAENGKFLVRSVVDGKAEKYGITGVDEGGLGMFFGRKFDNSVDRTIDGKTIRQDVLYTEKTTEGTTTTTTHKAASFTFNVEVKDLIGTNKTTVQTKVNEIINDLRTNAYNKATENYVYETYDELKGQLKDTDQNETLTKGYYVPVGKVHGVEKIKLGDIEYTANDEFYFSIGKGAQIHDKAFVVDETSGELQIAAPILAFELRTADTIEINGHENEFVPGLEDPTALTVGTPTATGTNNKIALTEGKTDEYDLTIKTSNELFALQATGVDATKGYFVTRRVTDGVAQFGLTDVEDTNKYRFYPAWSADGVPAAKFDGKTIEIGLYYVETEDDDVTKTQLANFKLHYTIIQGNTQLEELISGAGEHENTVKLPCDFELTARMDITSEVTLDLNGHTITVTKPGADYNTVLVVGANGKVTVDDTKGNGKIVSDYINLFGVIDGGELTINNGEFVTDGAQVVYVQQGEATINGGSFRANNTEHRLTLNLRDNVEGADIVVKGGKFYQYDPSHTPSENPEVSFVEDGYESNLEGEWYVVSQTPATAD